MLKNKLILFSDLLLSYFSYYRPLSYQFHWSVPHFLLQIIFDITPFGVNKIILGRVFKTLLNIKEFNQLGDIKVVILMVGNNNDFKMVGPSFQITTNTHVDEFIHYYLNYLTNTAKHDSKVHIVDAELLIIKSFTPKKISSVVSQKRFYSTNTSDSFKLKQQSHFINKLLPHTKIKNQLAVFDIETISLDRLLPYAIGLYYFKNGLPIKKIFYIDSSLPLNIASNNILNDFCIYIKSNLNGYTIFAHNFGGFDGIFIIKPLLSILGKYDIIMDKYNNIISISIPQYHIIFRDSYRLLPSSLDQLCKSFNVPEKIKFNHDDVTTDLLKTQSFKDDVINYLTVDIVSLYQIINKAQSAIHSLFEIDLTKCYSSSHLASTVFRSKYLDVDGIPLLSKHVDSFIRKSYIGGPVEVYKTYGENLYHYDIISLYPTVMQEFMPYIFIGVTFNKNLNDIFGFVYASVYIPKSDKRPVLYIKDIDGNNMTATGNLIGHFFSEELKAVEKYGYKIKVYVAYEFTKKKLFVNYVNDIFKLKADTNNVLNTLAKLLLNGLYGYMGRSSERQITEIVDINKLTELGSVYRLHNIIELDDNTMLITRDQFPDKDICVNKDVYLKEYVKANIKNKIKNNVAIASAITAYGRIHMMDHKRDPNVLYHDTDSLITKNKLDSHLIAVNVLGKFKDETKGINISNGYFLAPKIWGYIKENGETVIKSAGIPKNLINMGNIIDLYKGKTLVIKSKILINKMNNLTIQTKEKIITLNMLTTNVKKIPIYKDGIIVEYKSYHLGFKEKIKNIYKTIQLLLEQKKHVR